MESGENFGPPAAVVDSRRVALLSDKQPPEIAVVSVADGRIVSRLPLPQAEVRSVSPDGKAFYYTSGGFVWSIPAAGGTASKLGAGDSVAADPNGRDLIVSLGESESTHLVRLPLSGGTAIPLEIQGDLRLATSKLASGAVGPDGRIVADGASASQWSYQVAMIDPLRHTIARVPVNFDGELAAALWTPDGRLIAPGKTYSFTLWRFRPNR